MPASLLRRLDRSAGRRSSAVSTPSRAAVASRATRAAIASRVTLAALVVGCPLATACAPQLDTSRPAPSPTVTLGDDIYGVICDRIAATVDPWDIEARNSRGVCRQDPTTGQYANDYTPEAQAAQPSGKTPPKMLVLVKYRAQLITALNATIPDTNSLHDDLNDLLNVGVTLYDDDTIPEATRTLAAIMDAFAFGSAVYVAPSSSSPPTNPMAMAQIGSDVRDALARLGGRKGYRTLPTALGIARPILAYPNMADVIDDTLRLVGAGGAAEPYLRRLLAISQGEMETSAIASAPKEITGYADIWSGNPNGTPKTTSQILRNFLIDPPPLTGDLTAPAYPAGWQDKYGIEPDGTTAPVVPALLRDANGFAAFTVVPSNALLDANQLPTTNAFGQFLSTTGSVIALPTPFAEIVTPGTTPDTATRDAQGRALTAAGGTPVFKTMDASRTVLATLLRESKLVAAPASGALLDMLHAATFQFGPRSAGTDSTDPTIGPDIATYADPDGGAPIQIPYRKFDATQSPLVDLAYAATSFLQYPGIGDYLELTRQLMRDHPDKVNRVILAALKVRDLANQPQFASVSLDPKSVFWDDMIAIVVQIAQKPDLLKPLLESVADDDTLINQTSMASFFLNKDLLDYDPAADGCTTGADAVCPSINNPFYNSTVGKSATNPSTPNDLTKDDEANRSLFERFTSLMRESTGVASCNKNGATIDTKILGITVKLPARTLFGGAPYSECEAINIPDLAEFYLGCVAGGTDEVSGKARCTMPVNDSLVSDLNAIGLTNTLDHRLARSDALRRLSPRRRRDQHAHVHRPERSALDAAKSDDFHGRIAHVAAGAPSADHALRRPQCVGHADEPAALLVADVDAERALGERHEHAAL
jgi:hypothetical protein